MKSMFHEGPLGKTEQNDLKWSGVQGGSLLGGPTILQRYIIIFSSISLLFATVFIKNLKLLSDKTVKNVFVVSNEFS